MTGTGIGERTDGGESWVMEGLLRRRIAAVRCMEAREGGDRVVAALGAAGLAFPMLAREAVTPSQFVARWCGVGVNPLPPVAQMLVDAARTALRLSPSAESIVERAWRLEESLTENASAPALEAARLLLAGGDAEPVGSVRKTLGELERKGFTASEQFQHFSELLGSGCRPIVMVVDEAKEAEVATIAYAIQSAELAPAARLILVCRTTEWDRLLRHLGPHLAALLQDGLIDDLESRASQRVAPAAGPGGRKAPVGEKTPAAPPPVSASVDELRAAASRALRLAIDTAREPRVVPGSAELNAEARSLPEALLATALERDPRTAGLFCLNADGGFWFGSRRAEIDLFCAPLGIAVEVDGYFHFQDKQAYRRDRAKDWLMQRQGHLVLRFLAEDVVERLTWITDVVADAVMMRGSVGRPTKRESDG